MSNPELLTIGVFASRTGLTAGALRFYADSRLLPPASVDPASGYRYYTAEQAEHAMLIRRLREIDMPLPRIAAVLRAGGEDAAALIDEHVAELAHRARRARETAAVVRAALAPPPSRPCVWVNGSVFAAAVVSMSGVGCTDVRSPVHVGL